MGQTLEFDTSNTRTESSEFDESNSRTGKVKKLDEKFDKGWVNFVQNGYAVEHCNKNVTKLFEFFC